MTTEVRDVADGPAPEPDVLALGVEPANRRLRRDLLAAGLVLVLALAGYAGWQHFQPAPDFTLEQLEGAYAGMVRSDGTNEVSTIDASKFTDPPLSIDPPTCAPLFTTTVSNQFPVPGLDGVSTYWLAGDAAVSLFTVRYADRATAETAYQEVADALSACDGQTVRFSGREGSGRLHRIPVTATKPAPEQLAFGLDRAGGQGRYVLNLLLLSNTVTWQFRYDARTSAYDPTSAQQMMTGLATQLRSVQQTRVKAGG
jgi:hypothetical protein